jgi:hypothetical protein
VRGAKEGEDTYNADVTRKSRESGSNSTGGVDAAKENEPVPEAMSCCRAVMM